MQAKRKKFMLKSKLPPGYDHESEGEESEDEDFEKSEEEFEKLEEFKRNEGKE